ncbi:hypothetical protein [Mycoplana ramosa]|uniref:Uncharacterized protein n=1 Tax=Mycoplana ramosa TaxID=40837 RepID=A0ABW3YVB1_MYCRA
MTQTHSKSRQQAEIAFSKAQSQFFARDRAVEEQEAIVRAREEKTLRLREARLTKESDDRAAATASLILKRAKKPDLHTATPQPGSRFEKHQRQ